MHVKCLAYGQRAWQVGDSDRRLVWLVSGEAQDGGDAETPPQMDTGTGGHNVCGLKALLGSATWKNIPQPPAGAWPSPGGAGECRGRGAQRASPSQLRLGAAAQRLARIDFPSTGPFSLTKSSLTQVAATAPSPLRGGRALLPAGAVFSLWDSFL